MAKYGRYAVELNSEPIRVSGEASKQKQERGATQDLTAEVTQIDRFKELARELGCNEDEEAFDRALKRVAEANPGPKHEAKKRSRSTDGGQKSGN